jgi:hypothetical protein
MRLTAEWQIVWEARRKRKQRYTKTSRRDRGVRVSSYDCDDDEDDEAEAREEDAREEADDEEEEAGPYRDGMQLFVM